MKAKTYPVGTKIRYLGYGQDKGKTGKIVMIQHGMPVIFLSEGYNNVTLIGGLVVTWLCGWKDIELAHSKGEQLLFSFMDDSNA